MKDRPYGKLSIDVDKNIMQNSTDIYIQIHNNEAYYSQLEFIKVKPGDLIEPAIILPKRVIETGNDPLPALIDQLWNIGYRPSNVDEKFRDHEISAIKYHLEDMRRLVWRSKK